MEQPNPYQAPTLHTKPPGVFEGRPAGLLAVGVLGIILGAMYFFGAIGGAISLMAHEVFVAGAESPVEIIMMETKERYFPIYIVLAVFSACLCPLICVSGFKAIAKTPSLRRLFLLAVVAGVTYELTSATLSVYVNLGLSDSFSAALTRHARENAEAIRVGLYAAGGVEVVQTLFWVVPKLIYFYFAYSLLRREDVVTYFQRKTLAQPHE